MGQQKALAVPCASPASTVPESLGTGRKFQISIANPVPSRGVPRPKPSRSSDVEADRTNGKPSPPSTRPSRPRSPKPLSRVETPRAAFLSPNRATGRPPRSPPRARPAASLAARRPDGSRRAAIDETPAPARSRRPSAKRATTTTASAGGGERPSRRRQNGGEKMKQGEICRHKISNSKEVKFGA